MMLLLLVIISGFGCVLPVGIVDMKSVTFITNYFGKNLQNALLSVDGNVLFSPLSVSMLLSMLYIGAQRESRKEIGEFGYRVLDAFNVTIPASYNRALALLQDSSGGYSLEFANVLLSQFNDPIMEDYKNALITYYDAFLREIRFIEEKKKALEEINQWVDQKTHGNIFHLIDSLDNSTSSLVLLNAAYFKGRWKTEFDPGMTKRMPFFNNGGNMPKSVKTMEVQSKFAYVHNVDKRLQAIALPYMGEHVYMIIFLPFAIDGLSSLESKLTPAVFDEIVSSFNMTEVVVSLPRFKLKGFFNFKQYLKRLGIKAIFESSADLSIFEGGNGNTHVSDIIHKAAIEVYEKGSQAASVSGDPIDDREGQQQESVRKFTADHPFLIYIIENRTKLILFIGRVNEL